MNSELEMRQPNKLLIVWTSGDREVALKMVFMYVRAAKQNNWWDTVRLIVWGPSADLLVKDAELQAYILNMKAIGVELMACKACSDRYGVSAALEDLGIEVIYIGEPFTEMLKSDWKVLTF